MATIKLFRKPDAWYAQFSDETVKRAFGTDTIPTAFTANAPASLVFQRISALNPNALVEIQG